MKKCDPENSECVKNALYETNFEGATGVIAFDQNGDIKDKEFTVFKILDGEFVKQ